MARIESHDLRQAALLIHSLPEQARAAVLSRLSGPRVHELNDSLRELTALGIPGGREWIESTEAEPAWRFDADHADERLIQTLSPVVALAALQGQCLESVVVILHAADWPWADAVLDAWPVDQRHRLRELVESARSPARVVTDVMIKAFAQRARELLPVQVVRDQGRLHTKPSLLGRVVRLFAGRPHKDVS